jgi:transcriptional regulator with XRE-family HTH domain
MIAVRMLRQLLRCGQGDFAKLAGVSVRELIRIENSEVIPRADIAAGIDRAFFSLVFDRLKEGTDDRKAD